MLLTLLWVLPVRALLHPVRQVHTVWIAPAQVTVLQSLLIHMLFILAQTVEQVVVQLLLVTPL